MQTTDNPFTLAFIGGGNMATALAAGLIGKRCGAHDVLVVDPDPASRARWQQQGVVTAESAETAGEALRAQRIWVFAVKPQVMKQVVAACRPFMAPDTLVVSVAAGIPAQVLSRWLGTDDAPYGKVVRCMPNTPALIGAGATGLLALDGVTEDERGRVQQLLRATGEVVWVESDQALDAVTALSGSGPAYVFFFLEALLQGGQELGLSAEQSRALALATLRGATELAALSPESPATLRERVTSKGGTTAAALDVFYGEGVDRTIRAAMQAAYARAGQLGKEFG